MFASAMQGGHNEIVNAW